MLLRINDVAPDFTAATTEGTIKFHDWIGDEWVVLFSHPKDFTPVCTTELGYMAKLAPEFAKRNCKVIGLSIDSVDDHRKWAKDIEESQGYKVNYAMIGDTDLTVAKLYNMLPAEEDGTSEGRTAATNATVRTVFIIGSDKKINDICDIPGVGDSIAKKIKDAGFIDILFPDGWKTIKPYLRLTKHPEIRV